MDWIYCESIAQENTYPAVPGIYAVTICWDSEEGLFPGVAEWTGLGWSKDTPVLAWAGPFDTEKLAKAWAYDHDMEGGS